MSNEVSPQAAEVITGKITEDMIKQFVYDFQAEIEVTLKLVERIAYDIFGESEEQDMTPSDAYAYMACEYAAIDELQVEDQVKALMRIRFMRAVSVLSVTMGVPVPTQFLVLDRNVYDTIQAMNVIEKNKKQIDELAEAKAAAEEAVAVTEIPTTTH